MNVKIRDKLKKELIRINNLHIIWIKWIWKTIYSKDRMINYKQICLNKKIKKKLKKLKFYLVLFGVENYPSCAPPWLKKNYLQKLNLHILINIITYYLWFHLEMMSWTYLRQNIIKPWICWAAQFFSVKIRSFGLMKKYLIGKVR